MCKWCNKKGYIRKVSCSTLFIGTVSWSQFRGSVDVMKYDICLAVDACRCVFSRDWRTESSSFGNKDLEKEHIHFGAKRLPNILMFCMQTFDLHMHNWLVRWRFSYPMTKSLLDSSDHQRIDIANLQEVSVFLALLYLIWNLFYYDFFLSLSAWSWSWVESKSLLLL